MGPRDGNPGDLGSTALIRQATLPAYLLPCPPRKALNGLRVIRCMEWFTLSNLTLPDILTVCSRLCIWHGSREELCRGNRPLPDLKLVLPHPVSSSPIRRNQLPGIYEASQTKGTGGLTSVSGYLNINLCLKVLRVCWRQLKKRQEQPLVENSRTHKAL